MKPSFRRVSVLGILKTVTPLRIISLFNDNNPFIIHTFRPGMKFVNPLLDPHTARLKSLVGTDEIYTDPMCRTFDNKNAAYLSLKLTDEQAEKTVWCQADEDGDVITDDPVIAFNVIQELEKAQPINHPSKIGKSVKWEASKLSRKMPSKEDVEKILRSREKELDKKPLK